MRVLFLSIAYAPQVGGVERITAELLPALRKRGFEFLVVVPRPEDVLRDLPPEDEVDGIRVIRLPFWRGHGDIDEIVALRRRMAAIKRSFSPVLVHTNALGATDFFHSITASESRAPTLTTLHGEWPAGFSSLLGQVLRAAHWVTVPSQATARYALSKVPEIAPRLSVVHNACKLSGVPTSPASSEEASLLYVGRLSPEKGCDLAIRTLKHVRESFPSARLTVAGDGPLHEEVRALASNLEIRHAVEFLGEVQPARVESLIDASTCLLVPSRTEGFGLVALEAAHRARPVVATQVGGLPEVVIHGETGFVVEKDDPTAMARAVLEVLGDRPRALRMGEAAKRRAEECFGWERFVDSYDELYRRLIADGIGPTAGTGREEPHRGR